ncbi:MAG: chloride channel protein, partial [Candidatus Thioglobus sp.]
LMLVLASVLTVLAVGFFLQISDFSQNIFKDFIGKHPLWSFFITPITFVAIISFAKYFCHFVQGSGIPQLIAATDSRNKSIREKLLSFRLALGKIGLIFLAMLGGAPIGIEGPSIHVGGSIFYGFNRFLKLHRKFLIQAIIAIGGSAGLIVAFNAPLAGILFAYEEIGRKLKKQALILIAIVSFFVYFLDTQFGGGGLYLGDFSKLTLPLNLIWQLLPLAIVTGILGGVFAKMTIYFAGKLFASTTKIWVIALVLGLIVAIFNYLSDGVIAGSGHSEVLQMLSGEALGVDFVVMKFFAVLTSFASTIPGGVFMPSISIGAGIGAQMAAFFTQIDAQTMIILAMIGYLSAVIRAPLTSAFVVLEMTAGYQTIPSPPKN